MIYVECFGFTAPAKFSKICCSETPWQMSWIQATRAGCLSISFFRVLDSAHLPSAKKAW